MNYWVISPNVLNNKNLLNNFLEIINKEHIALMGYNEDDSSGILFYSSIKKGDMIIISKGANNNKINYFAGIVDSDSYKYKFNKIELQARKLKYFTDISNKNISWNSDCTYGDSRQPRALYKLKPNNPSDKKVINEVLSYVNNGGKMTGIYELLKSNKNLILTGAPGTGKTYLAKNIASQIILNKDYDESVENDNDFKEQCAFVQFHPSYDYTDFVEGLRPIQDEKGDIVFERKDGVFKKFCKKALKNLIDSKKDIATLNYEEIIKKDLIDFCNYINDNYINDEIDEEKDKNGEFIIYGIRGKKVAPITEIYYSKNEEKLSFTVETKKGNEYTFNNKLDLYRSYFEIFTSRNPEDWTWKDFSDKLNVKGRHTYIYGFLKAFYEYKIENDKKQAGQNNITVKKVEEKDFVFIIDEINRGEISKIFGELFFSVDSGYRGEKGKVKTQYANLIKDGDEFKDGFYIPENVYIIGTMNDIDRSVESMDFAMRRRFAWKEIKAKDTQETILSDLGDLKDEAIKRMDNLNKEISSIPELSDDYNIGASYFLKLGNYDENEAFDKLWENHLKGLLFEYTRGMSNQREIMIKLKEAYNSNSDNDTEGEEEETIEE